MKNIYQYIIENQSSLDYKKAIKTLVDKFGFREVRRGSETGVEKDGKYCKVQVEEFPYGGGYIVIDSRQLFTKMSLFDYILFIDHRKEFQNVVYVAEMEDLMGFLQRARDEKFVLWPTKSSERGTNKINPLGLTVRLKSILDNRWIEEYKPVSGNSDYNYTGNDPKDIARVIRILVNKFGFKKVRRGSETGVEKDGKYCKIQVEEFPYDGGYIVVNDRDILDNPQIFDYILFIDNRKKLQNEVYVVEIEDLKNHIRHKREELSKMWPTKSSELGKDDINPTGMTVRINPIKNTSWFHTYKPTISDNPDKIRMTPQNFEISSQDFIF